MKIVGLTGGIGSGKTTVAKMFEAYGVPVYNADYEAKLLMNTSKEIIEDLKTLLGKDAYTKDGVINTSFVAAKIFNHKDYLQKVNAIVHPKVKEHFNQWFQEQDAIYVIKEVAIIFENNLQANFDFIITVTAKMEDRMQRLLNRDQTTREKIENVINNQWSDKKKIKHAHFVVENQNLEQTKLQVHDIHHHLIKINQFL